MHPTLYSIESCCFRFELILKKVNSWPIWEFNLPVDIVSEVEIHDQKIITLEITTDSTNILLNRRGKTSNDVIIKDDIIFRDQVVHINKLWVNDVLLELHPITRMSKFYPEYSQHDHNYACQHQIELNNVTHTLDFFYNGTWQFEFDQPFFVWYNGLLIDDLSTINHWIQQSHLGFTNPGKFERLENLLKNLS